MRVLLMTAVSVEQEAVLRGLQGAENFDVQLAGVGPIQAAINTTKVLESAKSPYDLVISAGIAGGFVGRAEVGSIVVSTEIIAADLGAETPEGFSSLDELGFGATRVPVNPDLAKKVMEALQTAGLQAQSGPVLTLSTVTGTAETAAQLAARIPGAAAEGMEGYGVALAAHERGIPVLELRTISNPVGPRDRAAWKIKDALVALESASRVLVEVLR
ncbi:futalosine hydrolase [Tumebacillus sp. ITR2]|uniref:Futalosine hydrolase n=1 Tax=Tumebacillus amylolyticus TaxID=2801339 RepID=A0ABS1J4I0_9BACL|nr:futalosine hydrolase [Tumebacillus amylolyticus]MBL0385166.1 futalosine hydrolase [Tumebacillus amylolyticus]